MKITKYVVKKPFREFLPEPDDFGTKQENFNKLKNDQFLVQAEYISTDPYLRSFANKRAVPYDQFGFQVGKVIESLNPEYPVKMTVVSHSGWRDYAVLDGQPDDMFGIKPYDPQIGKLPLSLAVGALGMPGMTAYLGFLEICKPRAGDVVCVSSAAGTVGSIVGQIAKMKGCIVIGLAGTPEKVRYLTDELGFDHAFDYRVVKDIKDTILSVCNGIDCYFDNVGGELSAGIMQCMKRVGRVAVCGSISTYGNVTVQKKPTIPHNVKVQSFSFTQWEPEQQMAAIQQLKSWMEIGSIKAKENIVQGFDQLPTALISLLQGDNIGKVVVKVS